MKYLFLVRNPETFNMLMSPTNAWNIYGLPIWANFSFFDQTTGLGTYGTKLIAETEREQIRMTKSEA